MGRMVKVGTGHWLVWMEWHPAGWSVCLPLLIFPCTIKSRSFSSGTSSPGWSRKKGRKTVLVERLWYLLSIIFWIFVFSCGIWIDSRTLVSQTNASQVPRTWHMLFMKLNRLLRITFSGLTFSYRIIQNCGRRANCLYAHIIIHNIVNDTTVWITPTSNSQEWHFKIVQNILVRLV